MGDREGGAQGGPAGRGRDRAGPPKVELHPPRRPGTRAVLRPDPQRQGGGSGDTDAPHLAGERHRPRHQGREPPAHLRLARPLWPHRPVRPHQRRERRLQSPAGGSPRTQRGARRTERSRHPGRPGRRAGEAQPLGENQPCAPGRRHPARPLRRGRQDPGRRRRLPLRPQAADRDDSPGHDDHGASRRSGPASRDRQRRTRAPE